MTIRISSEKFGETTDFRTLEDAQAALRSCGDDFARITLTERNGVIRDETGDVVGEDDGDDEATEDEATEDEEDEQTHDCECDCCGCSEPATERSVDDGLWYCDACADYATDDSGNVHCSREHDGETCPHCGGEISWGGVETHSAGCSNDRSGSCGCGTWYSADRGGWAVPEYTPTPEDDDDAAEEENRPVPAGAGTERMS